MLLIIERCYFGTVNRYVTKFSNISKYTVHNMHLALYTLSVVFCSLPERSYLSPSLQSLIVVYDIESGQKRFQMTVGGGERGVVLIRHLLPLQGTHVVCSTGRELRLLYCSVKLKVD